MGAMLLADWIRARAAERGETMTHLKLQKLVFYGYGAALAHAVSTELGQVPFEAWKHGPVSRVVWEAFREHRGGELPAPVMPPPVLTPALADVLGDVVEVYGRLSPWAIRCETHLEQPWIATVAARQTSIDHEALRRHFLWKFARGNVQLPVNLAGGANAAVDGIPAARFESLRAMADALRVASNR